MFSRRATLALASSAFAGLALRHQAALAGGKSSEGYGPLQPDPAGVLDLPRGFSYRILSRAGEPMDDGWVVPDKADGMGVLPLSGSRIALIRNHELKARDQAIGPFSKAPASATLPAFDSREGAPLPGGTTTLIYDMASGRVERQYLSLAGTIRNCAGGITPWGSWLSCEEDVSRAGSESGLGQDHGWVFEVPATATAPVAPVPLKAMGRFNHEAACVDPRSGIVYLTEDRPDGLFYRFLPASRGELAKGGRLQALAFPDPALAKDSRNWNAADMAPNEWRPVRWIDLDEVESPQDDLRQRGHAAGAVLFARGEGVVMGRNELYFACTSGGAAKLGQIFRYRPSQSEGQPDEADGPGRIQMFVESPRSDMLNYGDNITLAPHGHLIVCEDQGGDIVDNYLRGITPRGSLYPLARLREQTELAGVCFAPDGRTMFVNLYQPGRTLAITGPWLAARG